MKTGAIGDGKGTEGRGALTAKQKFLLGLRVDVNRASAAEIDSLPGISLSVAEAIIRERGRRGGPFRRPGDLLAVPGIKEKRLSIILPFLAPLDDNN